MPWIDEDTWTRPTEISWLIQRLESDWHMFPGIDTTLIDVVKLHTATGWHECVDEREILGNWDLDEGNPCPTVRRIARLYASDREFPEMFS